VAFFRTVGQRFHNPPLIGAYVTQRDWRQKDLDSLLGGLADDPIGVLEIFLVRRGEIAGSSEWASPYRFTGPRYLCSMRFTMMGLNPFRRRFSRYCSASFLMRPTIGDERQRAQ